MKFDPYEKGGGGGVVEKVLAMKEGHNKLLGSNLTWQGQIQHFGKGGGGGGVRVTVDY